MKAVVAIKGGREAKTLEEEANEVASGGHRRPTTATTVPDAANVDDNEVKNGGRRCPTTVTGVAGVNDDKVASCGHRRPTTATTVADAANVDDDEAKNGIVGGTPRENPADRTPCKKANSGEAAVDHTKADKTRSAGAVVPRQSPPASTTTRSRAVGAAIPPRPSPTRPTLMTTRPQTSGTAIPRPTSTTTRPRAADAAGPPRPLWQARAAPPPPQSHDCLETFDKDSSSGTGEEFSLTNEDNFTSEDDEDEGEEDPERTMVHRARQRAVGQAAAAQGRHSVQQGCQR